VAAWGAYSYVLGGAAIYSKAKAVGTPKAYLSTSSGLYWWTVMTDYKTDDPEMAVLKWYTPNHCWAGFGSPMRCDLDHYVGFRMEFTRFVIIQSGFNNTTSVRLVTMVSIRIQ
jgi:hypothetical protein